MMMSSENILSTKELLLKTEELFDKDSDYFSLSKMIFKKELSKTFDQEGIVISEILIPFLQEEMLWAI